MGRLFTFFCRSVTTLSVLGGRGQTVERVLQAVMVELPRQYMAVIYVEEKNKLLGLYCPKKVIHGPSASSLGSVSCNHAAHSLLLRLFIVLFLSRILSCKMDM